MVEPVITRAAKIYLDEHGFIRVDVLPGAEETIEDAKYHMILMGKAGLGKRRPVIVNMTDMKSMNREARDYYSSDEAALVQKSVAIVTSSPVSKIIGNFFMTFNKKSPVPMKLFTSLPEAIEWSKGFLAQD